MALPTMSFVPSVANNGGVNADTVPDEVKAACEEVYDTLKKSPNGRIGMTFATKREADVFCAQAAAYCNARTDETGKPAPIRFRKSPTRGLTANQIEFRITDVPATTEETEVIREQIAAVNAVPVQGRKR